ncbi:HAD family hydrolase [Glacieibacterium sp.]|uniref:HAD family hydrolase n=1 Tax=Glacieibacterium sp. TaxID=2860237 RepID=UPI003B00246A
MKPLLIFDFDGVVADTEILANHDLAEALTTLGLPTSLDEAMDRYMGRHWADNEAQIVAQLGGPLPSGWVDDRRRRIRDRLTLELQEVPGLTAFLAAHGDWQRCIASSSRREWIGLCLDKLGLGAEFERRFSGAEDVINGKPAPDLFLFAAAECGFAPGDCVVIEDSRAGVLAGVSAGMTVIGLTAGSHSRAGHGEMLRNNGAAFVADGYDEVAGFLARRARP